MTEDEIRDHERRLVKLEVCYEHIASQIEEVKSTIERQYGRLERTLEQDSKKTAEELAKTNDRMERWMSEISTKVSSIAKYSSETTGVVRLILSVATPVIVAALLVYFR